VGGGGQIITYILEGKGRGMLKSGEKEGKGLKHVKQKKKTTRM